MDTWEKAISRSQEKIYDTEELLKSNTLDVSQNLIDKAAKKAAAIKLPAEYKSEKCTTLHRMIADYCSEIKKIQLVVASQSTYWKKVARKNVEPTRQSVQDILDENFSAIRYTLNDYWIDTYLSWRIIHRIKTASSMPLIMPKRKSFGCGRHNGWLPQRTSIMNTKVNSPKRA